MKVFCPISTRHPSLAGHFPGQPVLPGVVLLSAVVKALLKNPEFKHAVGERPVLSSVKFLSRVSPTSPLTGDEFDLQTQFVLSHKGVSFEMHEGARLVLRGLFAGLPPSNEGA